MRGPPPQPNVLKLLRGNPGKRRIGVEPEPQIPDSVPEVPSFLTGYASDEWYRVAPELHRLRLLTVVDVIPLAAYCQAYETWRTAVEAFKAMAARDTVTAGMLIKMAGSGAAQNPLLGVARRAAGDMVRYASEFGMTPVARARISAGVWHTPPSRGEFDGLLA
jgi:P27 family predicted phage terminase small subunit